MTERLIGDRYELLETLGEGGFARTYRAWDIRLERAVAIKVLRPHYASDQQFVQRFVREARAAASVSHPNVVRIFDFGQDQDTVFIAMQYVQGQTLRDRLRQDPNGLPEADAIRLIRPVLRGLDAIHAAGIVHRDIKPDNVLIDRGGEVLITDFGIALLTDSSRLTGADTTFGTAAYMAPEQARGETVTPATDIYSAAVILFELLSGRLPFAAANPVAMMMAHQQNPPPLVSQFVQGRTLSRQVTAAINRCLAKRPGDRLQTGTELMSALTDPRPTITAGRPETATVPLTRIPRPVATPFSERARPTRKGRSIIGLMLVVILIGGAAVAIAAYASGLFDPDDDPVRPAVVAPTSTVEDFGAPTISAIDTATIAIPTSAVAEPTSTPEIDDEPGIIVSAIPDSSPNSEIEPIESDGANASTALP
jgi:eukaryotic-like serine/threonine-protein kinase